MLCSLKLIITPYYTMIFEVPCGMRNACRIYVDYLYSNCNQVSPALKDQKKKYTCLNTAAETYKNGELINNG